MNGILKTTALSVGLLLVPVAAVAEAPQAPQICNVSFAQTALRSESISSLCGCRRVTLGFVINLQRSDDFVDVLDVSNQNCPALATVLTETVTDSIIPEPPGGGGQGEGGPFNPPGGNPPSEPPAPEPEPEEPAGCGNGFC